MSRFWRAGLAIWSVHRDHVAWRARVARHRSQSLQWARHWLAWFVCLRRTAQATTRLAMSCRKVALARLRDDPNTQRKALRRGTDCHSIHPCDDARNSSRWCFTFVLPNSAPETAMGHTNRSPRARPSAELSTHRIPFNSRGVCPQVDFWRAAFDVASLPMHQH